MKKKKCLSATTLRLFNDGQLSSADIERIGQHLEECQKCLRRLESLEPGPLELGLKNSVVPKRPEGNDVKKIDSDAKRVLDSVFPDDSPTIESHRGCDLYQIYESIGRNDFGQCFLATDLFMDQPATIIIPNPASITSIDHRSQFVVDAKIASWLKHENIVRVFQYGAWDETRCFLAMPEIKACSLSRILASDQDLDLHAVLAVMGQICQAISYAHSHRVLHRHLSPSNVYVDDGLQVLVSEFGLTIDGRYQFGLIQPLIQSTRFHSPEAIRNEPRQIDFRADVFSVGAILQVLLDKSKQIDDANLTVLRQISRRCQRTSRRNRFQTIDQLIEAFAEQVKIA